MATETSAQSSSSQTKRLNYINWEEYFMGIALLAGKRSKDPVLQVGACIVNSDNIIVGIGYNGLPNRCHDDDFPWGKESDAHTDNKHYYVCHAEMNAIRNKNTAELKNATIYVTLFPCNQCAKMIIQWGITEVIFLSDDKENSEENKASKKMLRTAQVMYKKYDITCDTIEIVFKAKGVDKKNKL